MSQTEAPVPLPQQPTGSTHSQATATPQNSRVRLAALASWIRDYREIIAAIGLLIGGAIAVFEYLATKREVKLVRCQLEAEIARVNAEKTVESLGTKIIAKKTEAKEPGLTPGKLSSLETEIQELDRKRVRAEEDERQHSAKLKPGACERIVNEG